MGLWIITSTEQIVKYYRICTPEAALRLARYCRNQGNMYGWLMVDDRRDNVMILSWYWPLWLAWFIKILHIYEQISLMSFSFMDLGYAITNVFKNIWSIHDIIAHTISTCANVVKPRQLYWAGFIAMLMCVCVSVSVCLSVCVCVCYQDISKAI